MSEWKEFELKDVTTKIGSGATPRGGQEAYHTEGISLIRSQNILDFSFSYNGLAFIDEDQAYKLKNVIVEKDDILINITGDSVARVTKVPEEVLPARVNQHVSILRVDNNKLDSNYLLYYLLNPFYKKLLLRMASDGATRNALTKTDLEELLILAPEKVEKQKEISELLFSYDRKINLLRQQNETLEELAQTLFKRWFVDFEFPNENGEPYKSSGGKMINSELGEIPDGWEMTQLQDLISVKRGGSPRPIKDYIVEKGLPWVKISDATATKSPFLMKTKEFIKEEGLKKTVYLRKGSLILSNSATPGVPKFLEIDACIHDGWLYFPKITIITQNYMYLLFLHLKKSIIQQGSGSVFTNLKTDILKEQMFSLASPSIIKSFDSIIDSYFLKIKNNTIEIQTLAAIRDTLLPKLMSGEFKIKDL